MQKFTLQAGTTNRHQWHKATVNAIDSLDRVRFQRNELHGIKGGAESSSVVSIMFGDVENSVAEQLLNDIGTKHAWHITKENADAINTDIRAVLPLALDAMPVDDMRKTPEQRTEQIQAYAQVNAERENAQALLMVEVDRQADELRTAYPWAIADDGKMSAHARAAKNMKLELKHAFPGVAFSVRSESFSMGNAVRIEWDNGPSSQAVDALTGKYQYYIDKCTDDNSATAKAVGVVLGQSKYVSSSRNLSEDLREQVGRDICDAYGEAYDRNARIGGQWLSDSVYCALHVTIEGTYSGVKLVDGHYVAQFEAPTLSPTTAPAPASLGAFTIEEHTHTKRGFQMYIAIPAERVERAEYLALLAHAKTLGGWYTRKWGTTPGGFAFESLANAEAFAGGSAAPSPTTPTKGTGDKLRALAEGMEKTISDKLADRQTNTAKRQAQANTARFEGDRLKRTQAALVSLAGMHDAGTVPPILAGYTSKAKIYALMGENYTQTQLGYNYLTTGDGTPRDTSPAALALWALLDGKTDEEKRADALRHKLEGLQFADIPGYFPTPAPIIAEMLDHAQIEPGASVLEPSAGDGALSRAARDAGANVSCYEINYTLREVLEAQGFTMAGDDFMANNKTGHYDRVLMNPPFENGQDAAQVVEAFQRLNAGGRIVSVMSPGPFYRADHKAQEFRAWFDRVGGEKFDLPDNAFKSSGTGVSTVLVVIDR